jgi:hypothetical protein
MEIPISDVSSMFWLKSTQGLAFEAHGAVAVHLLCAHGLMYCQQ